jgi:hypothetical protein
VPTGADISLTMFEQLVIIATDILTRNRNAKKVPGFFNNTTIIIIIIIITTMK